MAISEKKQAIWKDAVKRMNEEDLEFILDFPECFEPQIIQLVKSRQKEIALPQNNEVESEIVEETKEDAVLRILDELKCPYEIDEDGDIQFDYQDENFVIVDTEEDKPFIHILKYNWLTVSMDDIDEVSRLYNAINTTNNNGYITVTYSINEDDRKIYVHFGTAILFFSFIPNCKGYLKLMLTYFFHTRRMLEEDMQKLLEEKYAADCRLN